MFLLADSISLKKASLFEAGLSEDYRMNTALQAFWSLSTICVAQPVADNGAASPPTSANELPFQSTASIDEAQILPAQPANGGSVSSMDEDDYNEHLVYLGAPKV